MALAPGILALSAASNGQPCVISPTQPTEYPELVNTLFNLVTLIVIAYVTKITRHLDKEVSDGGE